MKKRFICVLLAACLLTGCKEKVNYIEQGTQQLEVKQYEEAIGSFEQSLVAEEDAAEAYRGLGMAYYEQQKYEAAREAFQKVIENEGDVTPTLYNFIGVCAMNLEDIGEALEAFQNGIDLAAEVEAKGDESTPDYTQTVQEMKFNVIICYEKQRDWESAKEKAETYILEYPDDAEAQKEAAFLRTR